MFLRVAVTKAGTAAKVLAVFILCTLIIIFSSECSEEAALGIKFCLGVLVPSLFPFMAISSFVVNCGLASVIGKPFRHITKQLFGLSPCFTTAIFLSLLGGYPVGARTISSIYQRGIASKAECEKAAMFAVCAGPGFVINFVGITLYNNQKIGLIMMCSQCLSVLIIGVIMGLVHRDKTDISYNELSHKPMSFSSALVQATLDSSKGMLTICAFVLLFSSLTGILKAVVPGSNTKDFLLILLEVCSAVNELAKRAPVELIAFAVGFGGLCVHFQIYSSLKELNINKLLFFCIRIIQGVITALITHIGLIIFEEEAEVFSTITVQNTDIFEGSLLSAAVLLGIAICFLYSIKNYKQN